MTNGAHASPTCNLVAIDVGRYGNVVLVETATGKRHRFKMANNPADFSRLLGRVRILVGEAYHG